MIEKIPSERRFIPTWNVAPTIKAAMPYVIGNTVAIMMAFAIARFSLLRTGNISWVTIRTGDWIAYYAGAHLVAIGHGGYIFDNGVVRQLQASIWWPFILPRGDVLPYIYHPYWALVLAPLGALSYEASFDVFLLINVAALATVLFFLEQYITVSRRAALGLRLAAWASLPVFLGLINGQAAIFILLFLTTSFLAMRQDRPLLGGSILALAAIKPPYVIPFLIVFVARRQWKALIACCAASAVLLAVPMLFMGSRIDFQFLQSARTMNVASQPTYWFSTRNAGLFAFVDGVISRPASVIVTALLSVLILGGLAFYAARARSLDLPLGLAVVAGILINPHVMIHDVVLLLLPVAVLLRRLRPVPIHAYVLIGLGDAMVYVGYFFSRSTPVRLLPLAAVALGIGLLLSIRASAGQKPEPNQESAERATGVRPANSTAIG